MNTNYFTAKNDLTADDRYSGSLVDKRDGRGDFAIDRDRVLYSKAFRRLSDKTQVFFSDEIKDLRTRLTHTFEVNQIAKTRHISKHSVSDVFRIAKEQGIRFQDIQFLEPDEVYRLVYPDRHINETIYAIPDYEKVHKELGRTGVTLKLLWEEYQYKCRE